MIESIAALLPGLSKLVGSGGGSKSSSSSSVAATVSPSIVNVVGPGQADVNSGGTASSDASSSIPSSGGYGSFPWLPTGTYGSPGLPQNRFDDLSTVRVPGVADQGLDFGTLLLIGGAGLVAFLTLSK